MTIVIATPHRRYDALEENVRRRLSMPVVRIREPGELTDGKLAALRPQYVFFPHWSWKIPSDVFEPHECVIFHMTDLPYGRGGSPLQNLIVRGHSETRLTALRCVADLDAGPVYAKVPLSLEGSAEQIFARAALAIENLIVDIVTRRPMPVPQQGEVVEFKRRKPEDGTLEHAESLRGAYDMIRMLDAEGYPHAHLETAHLHFEFTEADFDGERLVAKVSVRRKGT